MGFGGPRVTWAGKITMAFNSGYCTSSFQDPIFHRRQSWVFGGVSQKSLAFDIGVLWSYRAGVSRSFCSLFTAGMESCHSWDFVDLTTKVNLEARVLVVGHAKWMWVWFYLGMLYGSVALGLPKSPRMEGFRQDAEVFRKDKSSWNLHEEFSDNFPGQVTVKVWWDFAWLRTFSVDEQSES